MTHPDLLDILENDETPEDILQDEPSIYPELKKLKAVASFSNKIGEFIDWLADDKHIYLADYYNDSRLKQVQIPIQRLLAEFFNIDMKTVEEERQRILDSIS